MIEFVEHYCNVELIFRVNKKKVTRVRLSMRFDTDHLFISNQKKKKNFKFKRFVFYFYFLTV